MNAPFNIRGAAAREPFTAFVCDDATADLLKPIATENGWDQGHINKGGLRNAVQTLSVSASPMILFVDLSESGDPLNDIGSLAEVCEPGTVVIAAGHVNDVRLYRDLVNSGIQDYLLKPLSPEQLREAFNQAQLTLTAPRASEAVVDRPHMMTAFIGVRGGVGASALAASIAWQFSEKQGRSTALLDLDVHFGTGALALDLEPGRGLTDAIENPGRIDGLFIERAMVKANEKLSVLSAEAPINTPMTNDGTAFFQLQEEMKQAFECTVIDLPRGMLVQHPHLLYDVQTAVVVTEFTLAATRDTIRILSWLKSNAPQASVIVVVNRVPPTGPSEITRKDFESSIERAVDIIIPLDPKVATQAAKMGKPLIEVAKATKLGSSVQDLAQRLVTTADGKATEASVAGKSLLGKLAELKTKLPTKKAKAA
jgi:pilus assembly protein CpaE